MTTTHCIHRSLTGAGGWSLVTAAGLSCTAPVFAQTAAGLEEVIVTARKRVDAESVQDIPFAITAITQETLDRSGIDSLEGYAYLTPGLSVAGSGNGRTQVNIRGISSGEIRRDNTRASETVGIYFDEIPLSSALYNPDLEPFDLQRVEVLRGPQGTLYGSGSIAGTIRLISNTPEPDAFSATFDTSLASTEDGEESYAVNGAVNLPLLSDRLAARLVAYTVEDGGWIDNLAPGPYGGEDVNSTSKTGARASLRWAPGADFTLRPTYIYQKTESDGTPIDFYDAPGVTDIFNRGQIAASFDPSGEFEQWQYASQSHADEVNIFNVLAEYDFDSATLTSSSSYIERSIQVIADLTPTRISTGFFARAQGTPVLGVILDDRRDTETFAQEVRLASTTDGAWQWIGGVYYNDLEVRYRQPLSVLDPAGLALNIFAPFGAPPGVVLLTEQDLTSEQLAVFGELTHDITDKFAATVGLRWFDVEQTYEASALGVVSGSAAPTRPGPNSTSESDVNPRFLLAFQASDDVLVSAQASKGFRLGGPQDVVPPNASNDGGLTTCSSQISSLGIRFDPDGYDSETLWNYELAMKSRWAEGRVQFNTSAYHIDYEDLQVTTRLACGFSITTNASEATSRGLELESLFQATPALTLSFTAAFNETELKSTLPSNEALAGDELLYVPELRYSAAAYYERPITAGLSGFANIFYQYTGEVEALYRNSEGPTTGFVNDTALDAYGTINLRIGMISDRWQISFFVDNLSNEYGATFNEVVTPGPTSGWGAFATIRPRTYGVNLKVGLGRPKP